MELSFHEKLKTLLSFWLFILICNSFNTLAGAASMTLVAVFEEEYPIAKDVVEKVFDYYIKEEFPDIDIQYSSVVIQDGSTETSVCQKIVSNNPTILIDTTRKPRSIGNRAGTLIKKVVRRLGIPTVSATYGKMKGIMGWENLDENEKQYLVQIAPPGYIIPQVVRDIVSHQNMTTTGVLIDENIELDQKSSTLLQNIATRANILPVKPDRQKIQEELVKMKSSDTAYFFVIGPSNTINYALEIAEASHMTGREYAWYFVSLDPEQPRCNCKKFSALWMTPRPTASKEKVERLANMFKKSLSEVEIAFYYDLVFLVVQTVKNKINAGDWPTQLSYPSCSTEDKIDPNERSSVKLLNALKQEAYEGMFGPFKITDTDSSYQELSLFMRNISFSNNVIAKPKRIGIWTYGRPTGKIKFEPGSDLKNFTAITVYRVTTLEIPPFIYKHVDGNGTVTFSGYCIELIDNIKEILNFEYTITETEDKKFGTMDENLEWDGMIRDLKDKKAEIALGPISVMAERETVVDFTVPYYDLVGISILMKKPSIPSSLFKFLTVLEANVWMCILAAYFITSFLMYCFDRLSPYSYFNNKEKYKDFDDEEKRDFTLKESLWFCMTSLTPQGGGEAPRNLSGRLVAATWWLFGFIIIASYTANLAAFLTVSRLDSPIESLDDLAKQYKIKYAPQMSTSAATYFERMAYIEEKFYEIWKNMSLDDSLNETERAKLAVWDYPVSDKFTKIWWTMQETGMPKSFEDGIQKVMESKGSQEGFAFIADSTQVKYAVMTNCDLISVGSEFSRKPLALAVQQGSPLKDQLSSAILKLLNQRKLEGLKEKWWNKNPAKLECDDSEQQSDGISIANIGGVFIVILIGVVLAVMALAVEYFFYKNKKQSTKVITVDKVPRDRLRKK
ncbi:ionotropic receptor 25a [Parasteatoda tepidariorum]|uniref:ionotropic receptor 25a n=1 Tax=Parasteatoda tepidariorum TaxID=114398 RepID=UPI00077F9EE4|nr:ionotropic receptor 25a [Parasteatoda tepidariorum]